MLENPKPQNQNTQSLFNQTQQTQLNQQSQNDNDAMKKFNNIQMLFNKLQSKKDDNIIKDLKLENNEMNLSHFENYPHKNSLVYPKKIDQLLALTKNFKNQLQKKEHSSSFPEPIRENINLTKVEKEISEIENVIQVKRDIPLEQVNISYNDKFFKYDSKEQSYKQKMNLIKANFGYFNMNIGDNSSSSVLLNFIDKNFFNTFIEKITTPRKEHSNIPFNMRNQRVISQSKPQWDEMSNQSSISNISNRNVNNFQRRKHIEIYNRINEDSYFSKYSSNMQSYFNYKLRNKNINDIDEYNDAMQIRNVVQSLSNEFIENRSNLYKLISYMLYNKSLTLNSLILSSIKYYQDEFWRKISIGESRDINYSDKIKIISNYTARVSSIKFPEIGNKKEFLLWEKVYYLIHCGFSNEVDRFINEANPGYKDLELFREMWSTGETRENFFQNNKKDKSNNPFKPACFAILLKKNFLLNDRLLDDYNDYIWYHLSIISNEQNSHSLKLDDFQNFILSKQPNELIFTDEKDPLNYTRVLCSIMRFEDALNYLYDKPKAKVDFVNLFFILYQVGLCVNIDNMWNEEVISVKNRNLNERLDEYCSVIKSFADSGNDNNKNPRIEIFLYIRYTDVNYIESIANIIVKTNAFYLLDDNLPNVNQRENSRMFLSFFSDDIGLILCAIARIILKVEMPIQSELLKIFKKQLSKVNNKYNKVQYIKELFVLISFDICRILKEKKKQGPQSGPNERLIQKKYFEMFEEFRKIQAREIYVNEFKVFNYIVKLETVELIYNLIQSNNDDQALREFKSVLFPLVIGNNIDTFINLEYREMNRYLQEIYPDICEVFFYLLQKQMSKLKGIQERMEYKKLIDEFMRRMERFSSVDSIAQMDFEMLFNRISKYNHELNW